MSHSEPDGVQLLKLADVTEGTMHLTVAEKSSVV